MCVEVTDRKSEAEQPIELCRELETDVIRIDATRNAPSQERFPRQREMPIAANQRRDPPSGEDRRVFTDDGEVRTQTECGRVEKVRDHLGEYPTVREH